MLRNEENNKTINSGNPLKCCQFQDSSNSVKDDEHVAICEAKISFGKSSRNNNTRFQNKMDNRELFPKKLAVNLKFEDITFSANCWKWTLKDLPKGKIILFVYEHVNC